MAPGPSAAEPSPWVVRGAGLLPPGSRVLDLAAGSGRHARYLAALGHRVTAVDRDGAAIAGMRGVPGIALCEADLEQGPWPFDGWHFDGIVVTRYLHRPLFPRLIAALAPGGILIYETFMVGNEAFGRPRRGDFLLRPNELLDAFAACLEVIAFGQGFEARPTPAVMQRLIARRAGA